MAHEIVPRWFGAAAREQQPALLAGWTVAMARGDAHSYAQLCEMLAGTDFRDTLGRPDVPIRLVAGADDLATPPESLASLARITGAPSPEVLEHVGHVPSVECPERLAERLLRHPERE